MTHLSPDNVRKYIKWCGWKYQHTINGAVEVWFKSARSKDLWLPTPEIGDWTAEDEQNAISRISIEQRWTCAETRKAIAEMPELS